MTPNGYRLQPEATMCAKPQEVDIFNSLLAIEFALYMTAELIFENFDPASVLREMKHERLAQEIEHVGTMVFAARCLQVVHISLFPFTYLCVDS